MEEQRTTSKSLSTLLILLAFSATFDVEKKGVNKYGTKFPYGTICRASYLSMYNP
jgi:hypothetical protein